ncbi:methylated-DNA--[protein]-cysteine S-methyltransferase [Nonlabens xiamenensis]|uniref:methylated-DNA--[protein]-cysteine S-methyltransferase n=1 Tax=Nonlabens xiamenensis TaxID=2341043 RepID=UPI000F60ED90|nr:methylated-DNA--[protein]-cysteine S-methyltransferase [Nonlabens xiamenensis]
MSDILIHTYDSPLGVLLLGVYKERLCMADWKYRKQREAQDRSLQQLLHSKYIEQIHPLHQEAIHQFEAYFQGRLTEFNLPLHLVGTEFQQQVWRALQQVQYGTWCSYAALSRKLHNEKAIRAVAAANGANRLSIIIPCHRILGSNGALTGYAGGLRAKEKLLRLEKISLNHGQQCLF